MLNSLHIIAFTHRDFNFDEIGHFHLEDSSRINSLNKLKSDLNVDELMYLSTCNRVEFIVNSNLKIDTKFLEILVGNFISSEKIKYFVNKTAVFSGKKAVHHLFSVASSIDSLVVGEREIITQVRKAFEECKDHKLCGDFIRVLVQMTISTAKKVYTESEIATRPVSIVSLAFLELKKYISKKPKKIVVIGAGKTITSMLKFINKNINHQFIIFNRSTEKAENLVNQLNLNAQIFPLSEMGNQKLDYDFIITCTGSKEIILKLSR